MCGVEGGEQIGICVKRTVWERKEDGGKRSSRKYYKWRKVERRLVERSKIQWKDGVEGTVERRETSWMRFDD